MSNKRKVKSPPPQKDVLTPTEQSVLKLLKKSPNLLSVREVSERLDKSERTIVRTIEALSKKGYTVEAIPIGGQCGECSIALPPDVIPNARPPLVVHSMLDYKTGHRKIGATGDNHLGSKHERLDVLNAIYDRYADEGVTEVFNTGNWIEGEKHKLNFHDIKVFGMDDQIDYFIQNYPQRKGITTYLVAGDDHEGWYQQRERIEIGRHMQLLAEKAGRKDLIYVGYVEADIELKAPHGSRMMKIMHPGGGSAYAISYTSQKIVESFQGGEKPSVLLLGHYHKFDFCYPREVYTVQTACTCDQSVFMRKAKIQAQVGGCLIDFNQAEDGRITRLSAEFIPFFDRGFYTGENRRNYTPVESMPDSAISPKI